MFLVVSSVLASLSPQGHSVEEIEVAIVQGGGPQRTRATPSGASIVFANQIEASQSVKEGTDLVLWPENVVNPDPPTNFPQTLTQSGELVNIEIVRSCVR